ncbi:SDR family oxidoreductase [Methylobacterium persicinum]|uniref:Short-subunit dehydrogenase n=1 Tax=Methylobacterium persicinum TaxID=374426 RepID=A0ABU0HME3_9HYPH|nr:SDR family oxidoreductase [Methylobacterium persicinum]MDQ0443512.1 short-subunit dehydrogenase [Methylobacterium persicinum]GJE36878.1 3-phenylpropionate-dihydrodiol/cinnamic acid-dihydrodiol dehydrogenase [Methylobacterium persicinum]
MQHKPLADQTIVVTGASSGIGLATARMAASRGARVVLAARSGAALDRIADDIVREGGQAVAVGADVGVRAEVEEIAARAVAAFGGIDTWVNVAGLTIYGPLAEVSEEDHERLMRTNFWGTVNGSLVAVARMNRRGGALINVGSVASDLAFPYQGMYSASKHAVKGFTDALRMELRLTDAPISVTLVKPTSIDTPLPRRARNYMDREPMLPPPVYRAEEVAHAILHAAVHPQRDIVVGGAGKLFVAGKEFAPGAYDHLAGQIAALQKRTMEPRRPEGALHAPQEDDTGHVHGDQPFPVLRTSAYTRASLHPLATASAVVGLGLAAAALLSPGRRGRPH